VEHGCTVREGEEEKEIRQRGNRRGGVSLQTEPRVRAHWVRPTAIYARPFRKRDFVTAICVLHSRGCLNACPNQEKGPAQI
jgi:hypothetical protein